MKLITALAFFLAATASSALAKDVNKDLLGEEELTIYAPMEKGKATEMPRTVILRINTSNGDKAIYYSSERLDGDAQLNDDDFDATEEFMGFPEDDSEMEEMSAFLNLQSRYRSNWHYSPRYRHSYRHRYDGRHRYSRYYRPFRDDRRSYRYYYPRYRRDRFDRRHYTPYDAVHLGEHIYRFFEDIID